MMLVLRFHAMQHSIKLAWAHLKGPTSALPEKSAIARVKRFNPFRRRLLDPLYQLSLRDGSRKRGDDMDMISNIADAHEFGTEVAADSGYISMNTRPHV
jgi:hypothetical protein